MKPSRRIATALPMLLLALPASGHDAGAVHDHGIGYFLLLVALVAGAAALRGR